MAALLPPRILTATCLFDGHDVAINIVRRLLQTQGVEVIHLGINRSVAEVVSAALQEDVDAIAISSYQGGHLAYLGYLVQCLRQHNADITIFVGGGATITQSEAHQLEQQGITKVYTSADGLSLDAMLADLLARLAAYRRSLLLLPAAPELGNELALGRMLSALESGQQAQLLRGQSSRQLLNPLVLGVAGTGGAGKSTFIDELLARLLADHPAVRIAYLAVDPSWQQSGGALLGDRIRINSLPNPRLFMRSFATRDSNVALSQALEPGIKLLTQQGFELIIIESAGIGQNDNSIAQLADFSIYLMTKDYGSSTQLEKIAMLRSADAVILNKADQLGSEDAYAAITSLRRYYADAGYIAAGDASTGSAQAGVYAMVASHYHDPGCELFFADLNVHLARLSTAFTAPETTTSASETTAGVAPQYNWQQSRNVVALADPDYLTTICRQHQQSQQSQLQQQQLIAQLQHCYQLLADLDDPLLPAPLQPYPAPSAAMQQSDEAPQRNVEPKAELMLVTLRQRYQALLTQVPDDVLVTLSNWLNQQQPAASQPAASEQYGPQDDGFTTLSGIRIPHVVRPDDNHWDRILSFLHNENMPGYYPFTAGVFCTSWHDEEPTRMFAGEGLPEDTNCRFHYLIKGQKSIRLSTAFDPNTLYGQDPGSSPDVFACVGMSGVSVATLDDMKRLYSGINLCDAATSVSMTINGPAAILMAWFLHTAIDQQIELYLTEQQLWPQVDPLLTDYWLAANANQKNSNELKPMYRRALPQGHNGLGLKLLGISGRQLLVDMLGLPAQYQRIQASTYSQVRGTLQADILKEEVAQNECIFALDFALKMMADLQHYCCAQGIAKFYPVSVSGYHIGEAGANPVTQLAYTLANGFTLLEYFIKQGLSVDDVAPRLSFFFSNGMDAEYAVLGRVARRIWAQTIKAVYQGNSRSQQLKYHIQTSGRSLQSQELDLNDIRTCLQAVYALFDNCNSLHTNAFDETITTPTENSVYRALGIQAILNREFDLNQNNNPWQGSYLINYLTSQVEAAVYCEFENLARRGGVLGGIESGYQRQQIQQQSIYYERLKSDQRLAIVGVNCLTRPLSAAASMTADNTDEGQQLVRCSDATKRLQLAGLAQFHRQHNQEVDAVLETLYTKLSADNDNTGKCLEKNSFHLLMAAAPSASLSQLSAQLLRAGGGYRRNM